MSNFNNLVSGGAGFLGSNLIDYLLKRGENVICLDNFSTGSINNLKKFKNYEKFKIINHDVKDFILLEKIDKIWHFAAIAAPCNYLLNPVETSRINFLGTYNMLELAKINNAKFLLASTSEIYGKQTPALISEDSLGKLETNSIRSCYFESKRLAESLCFDYQRKFNLTVKVARIFNTYGPNFSISDGRVIGNFIIQSLRSGPLTIFGDGKQTRSFCYVSDLITALMMLMDSKISGPINLGNPNEIKIEDLAYLISNKINKKVDIHYKPALIDEPKERKPCIDLAKNVLNWQPSIDLDYGLDLTIKFYRKLIKA